MTILLRAGLLATAALTLTACGDDVDEERSLFERLNVRAGGPDEFLVIERAPLEVPPDIRALPAPTPGAPSRVEPQVDTLVAQALGAAPASGGASASAGEQAFLAAAGATDVPDDIRAQVEAEHQQLIDGRSDGPVGRALASFTNPYRDQQLDPVAEVLRLREVYPEAVTPVAPLDQETATQ
ncbi:DUF3035 domain-containing protein [Pontivivens ytuae]|uniref:DUF3035 domain-containing protein n=1 Tax=Pontivivens ytuae TaxID=2789856 RepID=A0A7S9LUU7_9RHOB|nr:DUF3035 domain-containing protein [Pontivivens ytuae]QPH55741.1 DUF3035 domain-containing protein [Pontivivens ytuae]